jgi:hypothetical protein
MHTTALKIGDMVVGGRDFLRRKKMKTSKCPLYVNHSIKICWCVCWLSRVLIYCGYVLSILSISQIKIPKAYLRKKNLRYGLEFMSGVVVNGNCEKQIFILAKVGYVSNVNGSEKLHFGSRFSKKLIITVKIAKNRQNVLEKNSK